VLPLRNADDLDDVPEDVKNEVTFHTFGDIRQVLDVAIA
jgi:ATP-dependent Lon protease